jgi:hypothetical protein
MEERKSDLEDDNDDHDSQLKCLVSPSIISGRRVEITVRVI